MSRLMKKADNEQLQQLQQNSATISTTLQNVVTELGQITDLLQDQTLQQDGNLVGLDANSLNDAISQFTSTINPMVTTLQSSQPTQ